MVEVHDLLAGNGDGNQALHSVLERARAAHGGDAVRRCIRQAMLEVDQAPIYTIHGFCQRALQENAFAADANFDAVLCAEITPVVQGWVMDFLRRVHLDLPVRPPKTAKLDSLTQRALKLTGMLRMRDPDTGNLEAIGQDLAAAVQRLQAYRSEADAILKEFLSYEGQLKATSYRATYSVLLRASSNRSSKFRRLRMRRTYANYLQIP